MAGQFKLSLDGLLAALRAWPKAAEFGAWSLSAALLLAERFGDDAQARALLQDALARCADEAQRGKLQAALKALREHDLRAPEDVALAGFDDIPIAACMAPALSKVQQDTKMAGAALVETLLAQLAGQPVASRAHCGGDAGTSRFLAAQLSARRPANAAAATAAAFPAFRTGPCAAVGLR